MNNSERFYYETDLAIKLMYSFLSADSQNHDYQARKAIKILKDCNIDIESFRFSFICLVDIASFALNKEKIEQQGNMIWDDYKQEITSQIKNFDHRYSKIPYFKEWYQVRNCSAKYLKENSKFWIKKIRDAFLHGQFELDYQKTSPLSEIKIFQGTATKTDVDIKLYEPGLTEFIEDNFRNVYNQGYGIKDIYSFLRYPNIEITNLASLEEFIKKTSKAEYKIDFNNYVYNGKNLVSKNGKKEFKPVVCTSQHVIDPLQGPEMPEYFIPEGKISYFDPKDASLLARLIDKKAGYIYSSSKKRKIVHKFISNYSLLYETLNSLLHEFSNAANFIYFITYLKGQKVIDYNKSFYIIETLKDNLRPALTLLQLYRLQYRLQNKNFDPVDYSKLDCEKLFNCPTKDLLKQKADKYKTKFPEITEKEAINKAYLEVIRDALAHGNIKIETHCLDDLSCMDKFFTFTDSWTDKYGNHSEAILISNFSCLQQLFTTIDKDLTFMAPLVPTTE